MICTGWRMNSFTPLILRIFRRIFLWLFHIDLCFLTCESSCDYFISTCIFLTRDPAHLLSSSKIPDGLLYLSRLPNRLYSLSSVNLQISPFRPPHQSSLWPSSHPSLYILHTSQYLFPDFNSRIPIHFQPSPGRVSPCWLFIAPSFEQP